MAQKRVCVKLGEQSKEGSKWTGEDFELRGRYPFETPWVSVNFAIALLYVDLYVHDSGKMRKP